MSFIPQISIITSIYQGESYIAGFLENVLKQSAFDIIELIIIHNQPNQEELRLIKDFISKNPEQVQHEIIKSVEPLGVSWNRGWRLAKGKYIAYWNVDDRREPDSLERQLDTLSRHPDAWLTYGDYVEVARYGEESGYLYSTPDYKQGNEAKFINRMETGGAFLILKRDLCDKIGFFDEQFKCSLDYEFVARICVNHLSMIKTRGLLGYFTNQNSGLSTRDNHITCDLEDTVVQLRYGAFDKAKRELLKELGGYQIKNILAGDHWQPVEQWIIEYRRIISRRKYLWVIGYFRAVVRWTLMKIDLWDLYLEKKAVKTRRVFSNK